MAQAYDLALEKIGVDSQALPVWLEYIEFLQSQKRHDDASKTAVRLILFVFAIFSVPTDEKSSFSCSVATKANQDLELYTLPYKLI